SVAIRACRAVRGAEEVADWRQHRARRYARAAGHLLTGSEGQAARLHRPADGRVHRRGEVSEYECARGSRFTVEDDRRPRAHSVADVHSGYRLRKSNQRDLLENDLRTTTPCSSSTKTVPESLSQIGTTSDATNTEK